MESEFTIVGGAIHEAAQGRVPDNLPLSTEIVIQVCKYALRVIERELGIGAITFCVTIWPDGRIEAIAVGQNESEGVQIPVGSLAEIQMTPN